MTEIIKSMQEKEERTKDNQTNNFLWVGHHITYLTGKLLIVKSNENIRATLVI
jgi:hypothetical protein